MHENALPTNKWQPVLLIVPTRLECACGALAIFVALDLIERDEEEAAHGSRYKEFDYGAYCQDCWQREQEAQEGED